MPYSYRLINAFANSPESGNPAGVVVLDQQVGDVIPQGESELKSLYPPDDELQRVATRLGQPMTAFAIPLAHATYGLRWFNPVEEAFLCGHATMATSAWLFSQDAHLESVDFMTMKYGTITAARIDREDNDGTSTLEDIQIAMDFPEITEMQALEPESPRYWSLIDILGKASGGSLGVKDVLEVWDSPGRVLLEVDSGFPLADMSMDCNDLASLAPLTIILSQVASPNTTPVSAPAEHIRSRVFVIVPGFEHEDHVTGSAHCLVVPYFTLNPRARNRLVQAVGRLPSDQDGNPSLRVRQVSPRSGSMLVSWRRSEWKVRITGRCVSISAGVVDV